MKFCAEEGIRANQLRIKHLVEAKNGIGHLFPVPSDAKQHEVELTDALKTMKEFIMDNAAIETGSTSFEL
jgi:hypothetical protein